MAERITSGTAFDAHVANFAAFWMGYGNAPGSTVVDTSELCQFTTGIPHPLFNGVLRTNLPVETVDSAIDAAIERFTAHHVPGFWWVGPTTQPANLSEALVRKGFVLAGNTPGMAVDLQSATLDFALPPGLTITRVEDAETLTTYLHTLARGSDIPETMHDTLLRIERGATPPAGAELWRYLGLLNGMPVATCAMVLFAGVAGIYAVATVPEARRKGIGAAITMHPLREARAEGYHVSTLQASEMGYPVYEKMGFRTVCTFALYLWRGHR